jgi:hypothetical protein
MIAIWFAKPEGSVDKARMEVVIQQAKAKLATLDDDLVSCNQEVASWTFLVLSSVLEDLQRLANEEPISAEIDRQKLAEALQTASNAITEGGQSVRLGEYSLARSDLVLLTLALDDIQDIINKTPG